VFRKYVRVARVCAARAGSFGPARAGSSMTLRLVRQVKAAAEAMEKQAVSVAAGGEDGGDGTLDTVTQTSAGVDPSLVRRRALTADADKMTEDTDAIVKTLHAIINTLHADAIVFTLYAIVKTLHTDAMTPS
jgi:hypothetical protein